MVLSGWWCHFDNKIISWDSDIFLNKLILERVVSSNYGNKVLQPRTHNCGMSLRVHVVAVSHRMSYIAWNKMCKVKVYDSMDFKDLSTFNEALLAKQEWRILHYSESLLSLILKAKYFYRSNFFNACVSRTKFEL